MSDVRGLRKFPPLAPDHPVIGERCSACQGQFVVGDVLALVCLGPGDDPEARQRARDGRVYRGVAAAVHWACATGETE